MSERLQLVPVTLSDAHEFVRQHHRHHRPSVGGLFAVATRPRVDRHPTQEKFRWERTI